MSSDPLAIRVAGLGKCYQIYDRPEDRLKQSIVPRLNRLLGRPAPAYYREFWALRNIDFEIRKGETVGIIGRNGSGKSTLLQVICGTLTPTTGTVQTTGRVAALLELGAGFNPEFTGRENVLLNAAILGVPKSEMLARMDKVIEFSELGSFLDQPVKTYSSGMHARLAFSTAIHVDPEILIVDETLAVGDARFVAKCMRRINDIKANGVTLLFVSHDVASVRTLCERAIWLDRGAMVDSGDVFPVTGRYMEYMFRDDAPMAADAHDLETAGAGESSVPAAKIGLESGESVADSDTGEVGSRTVKAPEAEATLGLDTRPVTHWGSHRGLIRSACVRNENGVCRDVHRWGSMVEVAIDVCVPAAIGRDHLSIAFSIKDLKGTDLIVSTTRDFGGRRLPIEERFSVTFRFVNPLATGRYLLVAAVENRRSRDIHYYEYFEGAHYFSSLADEPFFGLFQPSIDQRILVA